MNKKQVILSTALATILLVAIGLVLFNLYSEPESHRTVVEDGRRDIFCAVPSDAAAILHHQDLASLNAMPTPYDTRIRDFHRLLPEVCHRMPVILSAHYSSKNQVSWLMILHLSDPEETTAAVLSALENACQGIHHKQYDDTRLYRTDVPGVTYAVYGAYLMASTSQVVLESSLRHLATETSVLDDPDFVQASALADSRPLLYLNHAHIGKLYSGLLNADARSSASFAGSLADWSVLELDHEGPAVHLQGFFHAQNPQEYYLSSLAVQRPAEHQFWKQLPYNTHWALLLAPEDFSTYLTTYTTFLGEQNRGMGYTKQQSEAKKKIQQDQEPADWFLSLSPTAVGVAEIPVGDAAEKLLLIQTDKQDLPQEQVSPFAFPGYAQAVLGKWFRSSSEPDSKSIAKSDFQLNDFPVTHAFCSGSVWIIGSKAALQTLLEQMHSEVFFTWEDYLAQTPVAGLLEQTPILSFVANLNRCESYVQKLLKKAYAAPIREEIADHNLSFLTLAFHPEKSGLRMQGTCLMEQASILPVPPRKSKDEAPVYVDDTPVVVPEGPYPVKNFINGKQNWVSQHANHAISYQDHNRKSLWAIPFTAPIAGSVTQIDYYQNNKLQMAFAGGNRLCLLDRVGRWVPPFPVTLKKEVLLGPLVYDKTGSGEFRFMVLHTDNTIGLYNKKGQPASGWQEITVSETIRELPERTKVGSDYYWVLRTAYRTLVYDALGKPVANFDQHELMPDSKFVPHSKNEVVVRTKAGKDMILNLKTGEFKRYK